MPGRFRIGEGGGECVPDGSGRTRCANSGTDSPRPSVTVPGRTRPDGKPEVFLMRIQAD
ncbi:hypothetical protein [Streptomyces sp. NPDC059743]|uniref:hypothetical protein n=1 Tax=Streptomyces sp. NPDC059743 TaxID=3346928 RepID=UPI003653D1FB